ncbi:hypothetical protein PoB_001773200 [Plakobranchus ocellatus]|uniref:Uncharacterized protein n=1 Tax=Plakobranchus ocellatus TaxID=259542 RepID=A0AAV3Z9S8_9GAST|nr:hypothetical protein PoB_001773200 [Plakobranchus ocellatus]
MFTPELTNSDNVEKGRGLIANKVSGLNQHRRTSQRCIFNTRPFYALRTGIPRNWISETCLCVNSHWKMSVTMLQ